MLSVFIRMVESMHEKWENAFYQHFLVFVLCFQKLSSDPVISCNQLRLNYSLTRTLSSFPVCFVVIASWILDQISQCFNDLSRVTAFGKHSAKRTNLQHFFPFIHKVLYIDRKTNSIFRESPVFKPTNTWYWTSLNFWRVVRSYMFTEMIMVRSLNCFTMFFFLFCI